MGQHHYRRRDNRMNTSRSSRLQTIAAPLAVLLLLGVALTTALAGPRPGVYSRPETAKRTPQRAVSAAPDQARIAAAYAKLPLAFEANRGQAHSRARFLARGPGYTLGLM